MMIDTVYWQLWVSWVI